MLHGFAGFAVWCHAFSGVVNLVTAAVVFVLALVLFGIGSTTLRGERWILFLGCAFTAFTLQYGVRSLTTLGTHMTLIDTATQGLLNTVSWAIFSNLNSLFFLAAALDLLCWSPRPARRFDWRWLSVVLLAAAALLAVYLGHERFRYPAGLLTAAFLATLAYGLFVRPAHTIRWRQWGLVALFAASGLLEVVLGQERGRLLDGFLSGACLALLAYALFRNSGAPGRRLLASVNLTLVALYAVLQIVYVFVPWVAARPSWIAHVHSQWAEQMETISPDVEHEMPPTVDILDSGMFGLALAFKVALFLSALLVIIRYLSTFSPTVVHRVLDPVKTQRVDSLASQGILRAVGESIGSDLALLCFRLPGGSDETVMFVPWARDTTLLKTGSADPQVFKRSDLEGSTLGQVLTTGVPCSSPDWQQDPAVGPDRYWSLAHGMRSFVHVPLRFHGAVIGCLSVEWPKSHGYHAADLYRIAQVTEFLIPGIQAERWLSALAQLRQRLQHYNLDSETITKRTFLQAFGRDLRDVLGAFGVLVVLDFGFEALAAEYPPPDEDGASASPASMEQHFNARFSHCEIEESPIRLGARQIGKILLAVQQDTDPLVRPSLVHDPQQREAIAALVKDCALDAFRVHFRRVSERLHHELDSGQVLTQEGWRGVVESTLRAAGLPLLRMRADNPPPGESWPEESMVDETFLASLGASIGSGELPAERFALYGSAPSAPGGPRRLAVKLQLSEVDLYLEIARREFIGELELGLPWSDFLLHISEAADQALSRLRLVELEIEALQFEVNELLVHELRGPAMTFSMSFELLRRNRMDESAINTVGESARQLVALADLVTHSQEDRRTGAVPLREVLEYVERIQGPRLQKVDIAFSHEVGDSLIGTPFLIASLVIMTLTRNAKDAIAFAVEPKSRVIHVSATVDDSHVFCHVDDTGAGVPEKIRGLIFRPKFSTKKKGSGRGLPLARQTMRRQKGDVVLNTEAPQGFSTRFTIRFPRSTP